MSRRGENIYKRRDGRYEGRYVIGKNAKGRTKFGYVYGHQYTEVRNELLRKKAEQLPPAKSAAACCKMPLRDWLRQWLERVFLSELSPSDSGASDSEAWLF